MSGLRAKQKADRHGRILAAASELFRDHGYEQVKMEAIAAAAEVSIGTIYNYYQNKGDLLVAIVAMEVNAAGLAQLQASSLYVTSISEDPVAYPTLY